MDVVIPTYNAMRTVRRTIESVLAQTHQARSITVVDDGSRDETIQIVGEYAPRVRLILQENSGPGVARNRGVAEGSSEYIAFIDADDAWDRTKLERQVRLLAANPTATVCYTALLNISVDDGSTTIAHAADPHTLASDLQLWNPGVTPSCTLIRRAAFEQVGGFPANFRVTEDWALWLKLIQVGPFCVIDDPLTLYTVSNTGVSSDAARILAESRLVSQTIVLSRLRGWSRWRWSHQIDGAQLYKAALTARASHERSAEIRYLLQSLLTWPLPLPSAHRAKSLAVTMRNMLRPK